ncbi:MAG: hypothetical protein AAF703_07440 [Cyanobacteria bacterium P01_D01_bin.105]
MQNSDISLNGHDSGAANLSGQTIQVIAPSSARSRWLDAGIVGCLLFAALIINWRLIRDGITGLGDVRWHLTWLQHFSHQLSEGIGYPRWLAGTNFGYGSPTFVFYPPLIYYLGAGLKALGLTFEQVVNVLFTGSVFLSGVSFYSWGRWRWGQIPGLLGALAYMLSPGLLGVVHGGGLAPAYSFVWLPLLLLLSEKAIQEAGQGIKTGKGQRGTTSWQYLSVSSAGTLALVWGLVALTHLPSLLIYAIAWIPYTICCLRNQSWPVRIHIGLSALIGWGLAAFFLIPAVLEQRYINIDYMLASQDGFKTSMLNVMETLKLGWGDRTVQQWLACFVLTLIAMVGYVRQPKQQKTVAIVALIAMGIVFLMSDGSWLLWKIAPVVKKIEYSSRINRLLYLAQAALCTMAVQSLLQPQWAIPRILKRFVQISLIAIVCAILFGNFKAHHVEVRKFPGLYSSGNGVMLNRDWIETIVHTPFSDRLIDVPEYRPRLDAKTSPNLIGSKFIKEVQTGAGLPTIQDTVSGALPTPQPNQAKFELVQGQADLTVVDWQSDRRKIKINAQTNASIILRIYNYPAWKMTVGDKVHPIRTAYDGRIQFDIAAGEHDVILRYGMTSAFWLGISASILSAIVFVGIYCYGPRYFLKSHRN